MSREKEQRAKRIKWWIVGAEYLLLAIDGIEEQVHRQIDQELRDVERDEDLGTTRLRPTDHPLFQVALLLEQVSGVLEERIEILREDSR